ncbi:hypothetical protein J6590_095665 [Homalodisca vitripennis]|nr:hypothetical protein J6590_095665 [Homalodisca vitripennis]
MGGATTRGVKCLPDPVPHRCCNIRAYMFEISEFEISQCPSGGCGARRRQPRVLLLQTVYPRPQHLIADFGEDAYQMFGRPTTYRKGVCKASKHSEEKFCQLRPFSI